MSLRINQNILSIKTHGILAANSTRLEKSIEKLSSGLRINRASDDAAGLAISEKLRRQIRGLSRAVLNAQDGISMIQTAEGAMNESQSILQRMRELALQASNDTLTSNDRLEIQKEVNQLRDDINRIAQNTEFNTKKLLDGSQTALISSNSKSVKGMVVGLSSIGGDFDISIALISGGISQMLNSQIFTLKDDGSTLAKGTTQLQSIGQFYDSNGVFVLENPQVITINGNSKSTGFTVDGQMTLDKLAASIQNAIGSANGLDMSSKVGVVNTSQTGVSGMGGYFQITSGVIGKEGEIAFSSDQAVLNSLGISTLRDSKNNLVELTLKDSTGNVRTVRTNSDRASGILDGIDVQFSSQAAQIAGYQGLQAGIEIGTASAGTIQITLDGGIVVSVQFASGYWTMEGLAREINAQITAATTAAVGLSAAVVDGELRMNWEPPTGSTALSTFTIANASNVSTLGFNNGSYSGFASSNKDSSKLTWGFSRYVATGGGIAVGSTGAFTIGDQNTNGTTIELTAFTTIGSGTVTVNSDMVRFVDFQASANDLLKTATIMVRIDQIGGSMAFTSLRVGTENRSGLDALSSLVSMTVTGSATALQSAFLNQFGMSAGTVKGTGDKNFRVHVVHNNPQYQIGADQGQVMKIAMADMGARALNVDNLDMTSIEGASEALGKINKAIDSVSAERSKLGSFQNRLEYAINNLRNTHSNMVAAESRIRDADIAMEMIEFTRNQIVSQSGTAMLAQANLVPQGVLQLLK